MWNDLDPDPRMVAALNHADAGGNRATVLAEGDVSAKRNWSNRFADACARMVSNVVRARNTIPGLQVLPDVNGAGEPPVFVAGGKRKRVDVVMSSPVSGLQVGFSLKGLNFRDGQGLHFVKNLTGRTYELQDELRMIHGYQPAAFMVALYFLPLGSTCDKPNKSSFARTVEFLRARTGRLDPSLPSQAARADFSVVGLYCPGDHESVAKPDGSLFIYQDPFPRGVVRYFDVQENPPRTGRPTLDSTLSLDDLVARVLDASKGEQEEMSWAEPEPD